MLFEKEIILEDDNVLLRPVSPGDIDGFRKIFFNNDIWQHTVSKINTEEELKQFIETAPINITNKVLYTFTIIDKNSGEIAGTSSFGNYSENDSCVEIGWSYLGKDFWGTNINTHAKYNLLRYAFEALDLHRVEFKTDDANPRSGRALLKIGCTKEGVLRSKNLLHNGRRRDTAYYSILSSEWQEAKEKLFKLMSVS
jgi:N-acetyltransferase